MQQYEEFTLLGVKDCENVASNYNKPVTKIATMLKAKDFLDIEIIYCSLKATFIVSYCSYNYISGYRLWDGEVVVAGTELHLSRSECLHAIKENQLATRTEFIIKNSTLYSST